MTYPVQIWLRNLALVTKETVVTNKEAALSLDQGVALMREIMRRYETTTFIAGNGGSLAAAAHMATDFNLAGLRTVVLHDAVALTSHANDFGVEAMFTKQLEWYTRAGDTLILLSCSGKSPNMIDAARFGKANGLRVVTFTGFEADNPLRHLGELSFYVPAHEYGYVQLAHEAILHAACDLEAWGMS